MLKTRIFDVFSAKLLLQRAVELRKSMWNPCSRYLKHSLNSGLSVSKKIRVIRRVEMKILQEMDEPVEKWA